MQVSPTSSNWDGTELTETVTTISNSCPAIPFGNPCGGTGPGFVVGVGGRASVPVNGVDTPVGPVFVGAQNIFLDQHTLTHEISDLDAAGINNCTAVCQQIYYCEGIPIASHTITYSFLKAQINGTHVTSTEASKQ